MGIEATQNVKKEDAINFLRNKGLIVYENDCCERLSDMMYEHRDSIFENYSVFEKSEEYIVDHNEWQTWW